MFRHLLTTICFALLLPISGADAGEAQTDITPLSASLQREPVRYAVPVYRAYASAGKNRFAFLVPQGFWLQGDPASGKLTLVNKEGNCTLTFAVIDSRPAETLDTDSYRELVLKEQPKAKIVRESSADTAGRSGPMFDVQWKVNGDILQTRRVIFIPTSAGVIQFTATTARANFPSLQAGIDTILMSFRYSTNGKLEVAHLSDKI